MPATTSTRRASSVSAGYAYTSCISGESYSFCLNLKKRVLNVGRCNCSRVLIEMEATVLIFIISLLLVLCWDVLDKILPMTCGQIGMIRQTISSSVWQCCFTRGPTIPITCCAKYACTLSPLKKTAGLIKAP